MVHIRTILTLYIVILTVNNVLVEAGQGTKNRRANLKERASTHNNVLKKYEKRFTNKFGSSINPHIEEKLTKVSNIIIDHIMAHESFLQYLKSVFKVLQTYAVGQINSRFEKLETVYGKWKQKKFPDENNKSDTLKTLNKQEKGNKGLERKNPWNEKKSKK